MDKEDREELEKWVLKMWESLARAGDGHFARGGTIGEHDDGSGYQVTLSIVRHLPPAKKYIAAFVRQYAKERGWRAKNVRFRPRHLEFKAVPPCLEPAHHPDSEGNRR
jgi:hypothetical protein